MIISLTEAAEFLKERDNYTILCHINPDGDTLGCAYALREALRLMGKPANVLCADKPSERFGYLFTGENHDFHGKKTTVVTVDTADLTLLGDLKDRYAGRIELCIDHHVTNKMFAKRVLLDENAAACSEIIWELIIEAGVKPNDYIASAIYTGISTDTGCFKYSNTTAKTHLIAARLMDYDFDIARINYVMFDMKTRERAALEQTALGGIKYYLDGKCAVITLARGVTDGLDPEDIGFISALPRQIEGVEAGVVIKEKDNGIWKISMRTGSGVNAQAVCSKFGGGGHLCAAGCTVSGDADSVADRIIAEIGKQLNYKETLK